MPIPEKTKTRLKVLKDLIKAIPNWYIYTHNMDCTQCARITIGYKEDDCTFDFMWLVNDRRKYVQSWKAAMVKGIIATAREYEKRTKPKKHI